MSDVDTAADRLTAELRRAILRGDYAPGDKLPPERDLAERFDVNRVTVRSALARLESTRLVTIRHGSGCVVRDYRKSGGLELVGALVEASQDAELDPADLAQDLLELRRAIARAVLERLTKHVDERAVARIAAAVDALEEAVKADAAPLAIAQADLDVFRRIVEATDSVVFLLCVNPVAELLLGLPGLAEAVYAEPYQNVLSYRLLLGWLPLKRPEMVGPVLQALEAHDRAAVRAMRRRARR